MIIRRTLRLRLAFGFAVFVLVVCAIISIAILEITEEDEDALIARIIEHEMTQLIEQFRINPQTRPPRTRQLYGYIIKTENEANILPEILRSVPVGISEVEMGNTEYYVGLRKYNEVRFYIAYDATFHEQRVDRFIGDVLWWVIMLGILALVTGYYMAAVITRPVRDLADRVMEMEPGDDKLSLEGRYRDLELIQLASAFEKTLARIFDLLNREKMFTADVSHELRTPLTSILTGSELLLSRKELDEDNQRRVEAIHRAARRMEQLVTAFLMLARNQARTDEEIDLSQCLNLAEELLGSLLRDKNIALKKELPEQIELTGNANALVIILNNLLRNAAQHAGASEIIIRYQKPLIKVIDNGRGMSEEEAANAFDRYYQGKGEDGFGLGLSIVSRLCKLNAWDVKIADTSSQGTVIDINFFPTSQ